MSISVRNTVSCNLLDHYFFSELREMSQLLKRYDATLTALTPGFSTLLEDLFFLLYKIEPLILSDPTPARPLLNTLMESYTLKKLRGRTSGNRVESYLALKLLLDELLLKLRGTKIPEQLEHFYEAMAHLQSMKTLIEKDLDLLPDGVDSYDPSTIEHLASLIRPLGLPELSSLALVAATLSESLRALSFSPSESEKINSEKSKPDSDKIDTTASPAIDRSENNSKVRPEKPAKKNVALEEALISSLSSDLSEFLERLDKSLNTDKKLGTDDTSPRGNESQTTELEKSPETSAEELASELETMAYHLKTSASQNVPDAQSPAGFHAETYEGDAVDQWRIIEGKANGIPVASSLLGYDGNTQRGGGFKFAQAALNRLNEQISRLESKLSDTLRPIDFNAAIQKSIEAVDQFGENVKALGVNTGLEVTDNYDHVLTLYKSLKDPSTIRFLNKVGKKREIARRAQYKKRRKLEYLTDKVSSGDRLDAIIDEEIMTLSMNVFDNDFYDRFLNQNLLIYEHEGRIARDRGPIVLCYDGSGSMEGVKIEETKALILAFIEVARIQKRRLITLQFASKSEPLYLQEFNPNSVSLEEIMRLLEYFIRGGTDFEKPLRAAVNLLKDDHYRHADILMITDGFSDIREDFKNEFRRYKADMSFKLYAIIIHGETYGDYGDLGEISDEILEIKDRDLSNWNEKISNQLFEMI